MTYVWHVTPTEAVEVEVRGETYRETLLVKRLDDGTAHHAPYADVHEHHWHWWPYPRRVWHTLRHTDGRWIRARRLTHEH